MRILLTGGGTGGHFYPLIAVAESLRAQAQNEHIVGLELYYASDTPYDEDALTANDLRYVEIRTGKIRTYASAKNIVDKFLTFFAVLKALWKLFVLYPDVVFGKGGYASFPAVCAARILRIPVVIHESDSIPGRVNRWAATYATNVAIAFPEAIKYLPHQKRVAHLGNPIRRALRTVSREEGVPALGLDPNLPTVLVVGGSQGSEKINERLVDILPRLLEFSQVIHQVGKENMVWMKTRTETMLKENPNAARYHIYPFLDQETLRHAAGAADLIIARAGSSIFEFALWGVPSILVPLPIAREDHQRENAYNYARTGAAIVIEEANLHPELLLRTIIDTLSKPDLLAKMKEATKAYARPDASERIADLLLSIARSHV